MKKTKHLLSKIVCRIDAGHFTAVDLALAAGVRPSSLGTMLNRDAGGNLTWHNRAINNLEAIEAALSQMPTSRPKRPRHPQKKAGGNKPKRSTAPRIRYPSR